MTFPRFYASASVGMSVLTALTGAGRAQTQAQKLQLKEGWNAVHLRVTPAAEVAALFAGTPVDLVTAWYPEKQKVASLQDLSAEPWKAEEWRTWQAAGRPGAFLNNLHAMESGRAYLIRARTAAEVTVTGTVTPDRLRWLPQSFNLTGLPADPAGPATLGGFFAASAAHQPLRVFRLVSGKWQAVPATAAIDPATAYWIWCGEGSEYQGPLDLRAAGTLMLSSAEDSVSIGLLSTSANPLTVRVTATGSLPLSGVTRERFTGAASALIGSTPVSFPASPAEPQEYRFSWTGGSVPPAGAASLLEFRAAGVRLTVPVRFLSDTTVP